MTSVEAVEAINDIIKAAVQRAGGDSDQDFYREVAKVIAIMGTAFVPERLA